MEIMPGVQLWHEDWPCSGWNFPRGHCAQYARVFCRALLFPNLPAAHEMHVAWPRLGWNHPWEHMTQPPESLPYSGFALPAGHGSH